MIVTAADVLIFSACVIIAIAVILAGGYYLGDD